MRKEMKQLLHLIVGTAVVLNAGTCVILAEEGFKPGGEPPAGSPPEGGAPGGMPGGEAPGGAPGGGGQAVDSWSSVTEFTADTEESDGTYTSEGSEENAVLVSGGTVTLTNPTVLRSNSTDRGGDDASFYGVGAAVLNTGGTLYVSGGTIDTEANGAAGIFSYSDGVTYAADTVIRTEGNTSGGIHAAGGGTLYAYNIDAETQGESSAAIRSDRGGGTIVVDGGRYVTNGTGSPAVYVTADITVHDAELTANASEGICVEGLNTLRLFDCDLTSSMQDLDVNDHTWSVILYQSMSGDSEIGTSEFYMKDGSLYSSNGGLFYTTNTSSKFYIENVEIIQAEDAEYFLQATGNNNSRGWGTSGQNGADTDFTAVMQVMNGNVIWDSISELDFWMIGGSELHGAVIQDESYAGSGGDGYAAVYIDETSAWYVTGDSRVSKLVNDGLIVDEQNRNVTVVGTDGTVYLEGTSDYTVTVDEYSEGVVPTEASAGCNWEDYAVELPAQLSEETAAEEASEPETTAAVETAVPETAEPVAETQETKASFPVLPVIAGAAVLAGLAVLALRKKK